MGINAASAHNRRSRNSSLLTTPSKSSIIAQVSRVSPRRPSTARSLSLLLSHQQGSGAPQGSIKQSSTDLLETVKSAAQERWRGLGARLPARKPSVQAPITAGKPDIQVYASTQKMLGRVTLKHGKPEQLCAFHKPHHQSFEQQWPLWRLFGLHSWISAQCTFMQYACMQSGRAQGGSRFAQLVQQVTVPSWMQGYATPSAPRALTHTHVTPRMDAASDLLSQINASMNGPPRSSTGAQPVKSSDAGEILAMLEASLQPPSPQHAVPSIFSNPGIYLAADELTEINKQLSRPVSSGRQAAQTAAPYHQDIVSNSRMQQLSQRHNVPERHSPVPHSPRQVYVDAQPAQRLPMQQESGFILDTTAYDLSQHEFIGQPLPDDHRCVASTAIETVPVYGFGQSCDSRHSCPPHDLAQSDNKKCQQQSFCILRTSTYNFA